MDIQNLLIKTIFIISAILLTACSSHIPPEIRHSVEGAPTLGQVQQQPDTNMSLRVRWGGLIADTENKQQSSRVTVVAFPLSSRGEPRISDQSQGRFIAEINEFLEPMVYSQDREITFTGTVTGIETGKVGDHTYQYPVVQVEHYYLWPQKTQLDDRNYPPYWHDPWYFPYYPYYPRYIIPYFPHRHDEDS